MLSPERAEVGLLSSVQTPRDLSQLVQAGVTAGDFLTYGSVFDYYLSFAREYGALPQREDLVSVFSHLALELETPGELAYYVTELHNWAIIRQASASSLERFGENGERLYSNPEEAIRLLAEDLRKLQRGTRQHVEWVDRDAMQRLGWLVEKAEAQAAGGVIGVPTGLRCFDTIAQGWGWGEAIMVMAPKGVGKSWLLILFGAVGYEAGHKVLLLSPEMSNREVALRFDVLLAYRYGEQHALRHSALTSGAQDQAIYEDWLKRLTARERFIVVDSPGVGGFTVASILALVDEHRPDIVLLDGIHLVGSDTVQSGWERIKQTADALKAVAQHQKCVAIWTSQVDREAMKNPTEPAITGASAAYGKAAVEAANRLITLGLFEGDSNRRTFRVPNNRSGPEFHVRQHLVFDVDRGAIYQMDPPDTAQYENAF